MHYITQIIIAFIIILVMALTVYSIYNKNIKNVVKQLVTFKSVMKKEIKIIDGFYDFDETIAPSFNTTDKSFNNYIDITPSINQDTGIAYTYNFWIFIPEPNKTETGDAYEIIPLFIKGSNKKLNYYKGYAFKDSRIGDDEMFLIKNPLVNLKRNITTKEIKEIYIELNALNYPDLIKSDYNTSPTTDQGENFIGIKNLENRKDLWNKWSMITFTVSETNTENLLQKNLGNIKLYLNSFPYLDKYLDSAKKEQNLNIINSIKRNYGKFYINPEKKTNVTLSDITFFNYLLDDKEIITIFNKGCNKTLALIPGTSTTNFSSKNALIQLTPKKYPVEI